MLQKIKIRDRKAPRFRWSRGRYIVLNRELFQNYKAAVEKPIEDYNLFKDIIEDFNEEIKNSVISNRDGFKLPAMMGVMGICSYKTKTRPPVDWAASEESGLKLREYNLHTGGLSCKIVYSVYKAKYKFRNWALWRFEGNRDFKTRVSSAFIEDYTYYKRMDNKSQVSKMFNDNYIKGRKIGLDDELRTYISGSGDEQTPECGYSDNGQIHI